MSEMKVTIHPESFMRHYTPQQMAEKLAYCCNVIEPRLAELEEAVPRIDDINAELCKQWDEMHSDNERLRAAIKNVIAYEHCGECGNGCLVFFEEKPCHASSKPCAWSASRAFPRLSGLPKGSNLTSRIGSKNMVPNGSLNAGSTMTPGRHIAGRAPKPLPMDGRLTGDGP
jgi:hypothetical protein